MIRVIQKDLFLSSAKILVHQVNTEGVMGAGIAKTIKEKYPIVFQKYKTICQRFTVEELLGKVQLVDTGEKKICNLFAESLNRKIEGNRRTDYDSFRNGLHSLFSKLEPNTTIAMPYNIGCGLGGGDWKSIFQIIKETDELFQNKNCEIEICSLEPIPSVKDLIQEEFSAKPFKTSEAEDFVSSIKNVNKESVRARIYEGVKMGIFKKLVRGVYTVSTNDTEAVLIHGDGRDLSMIEDASIDAIITDHPYLDEKGHTGGNRNFATYDCFRYTLEDFKEKYRVLKEGSFLVEFLPEESETNFEYLYQIKQMAIQAGFQYYSKVPYRKGSFISNTGRKSKATEEVMFFTKGDARSLRPDAKKNLADAAKYFPGVKLSSPEAIDKLIESGHKVNFMKGAAGMLPVEFNVQPPSKKEKIHQAEKPVDLLRQIIRYVTLPGEIILDHFAGSGVLGEAASLEERNSIMIEIDKENVDKIINRLKLTAVLTA